MTCCIQPEVKIDVNKLIGTERSNKLMSRSKIITTTKKRIEKTVLGSMNPYQMFGHEDII